MLVIAITAIMQERINAMRDGAPRDTDGIRLQLLAKRVRIHALNAINMDIINVTQQEIAQVVRDMIQQTMFALVSKI